MPSPTGKKNSLMAPSLRRQSSQVAQLTPSTPVRWEAPPPLMAWALVALLKTSGAAIRTVIPGLPHTPIEDGVRETMASFRRLAAENRLETHDLGA